MLFCVCARVEKSIPLFGAFTNVIIRMCSKVHLAVFCEQLSESLTEGIVPFDATSETPLEEQRTEAMVKVQDALLARLGPEALGLLRAARSARLRSPLNFMFGHITYFTLHFSPCSGRCGQKGMCLVRLMWNLKKNWNSLSRSSTPTCHVSYFIFRLALRSFIITSVQNFNLCLLISGSSPPELPPEDDDAAELEEEELESIQVSEREFNFFDFIKR